MSRRREPPVRAPLRREARSRRAVRVNRGAGHEPDYLQGSHGSALREQQLRTRPARGRVRDGENGAITIHKRGAVIPANRLDGIFNPIKARTVPLNPVASGPTRNLGLGLYIAERIVHAHGGRIEVESSEARGTNFHHPPTPPRLDLDHVRITLFRWGLPEAPS